MPTAIVLGGGLAGLTVAKELQTHGFAVTLLEKADRVGGKAGARDNAEGGSRAGMLYEHGYHIFPPWYLNVLEIVRSLNIRMIEIPRWHVFELQGDGSVAKKTLKPPTTPLELLDFIRNSPAPAFDTILSLYFVLDMIGQPLSRKALLDQVSRVGLMRDRWYVTSRLPTIERESMLKASAIPVYEMSAYTAKLLSSYFLRTPKPALSILPGDLQTTMIEPYAAQVAETGVSIKTGYEALKLVAAGERGIAGVEVRLPDGTIPDAPMRADLFVVTTPADVSGRLFDEHVLAMDPGLGNIQHLRTAPMAALHLSLNHKVRGIPKEHVFLSGGQYGLSFIDVSQHWKNVPPTTLSFIASDFAPLQELRPEEQYNCLMDEIMLYLPIHKGDVDYWTMIPNTEPGQRLFINTVGSWPHRPRVTSKIPNLFFAGDWVKNKVDLTCMEGAVSAALHAAHAIGKRWRHTEGVSIPAGPLVAPRYPPWLIRLAVAALAPSMSLVYLGARLNELINGSENA